MKMARREIRTATIAAYESKVSSHFKVEMLYKASNGGSGQRSGNGTIP